jgi:hypothetical protein
MLSSDPNCILVNHVAHGWRQPNGFDFPPAYIVTGNSFHNVDLIHYVINPQWDNPTATNKEFNPISSSYNWDGFTSAERMTSLVDEDGSLAGFLSTSRSEVAVFILFFSFSFFSLSFQAYIVNADEFFDGPNSVFECKSLNTSYVSPHHYFKLWSNYTPSAASNVFRTTLTSGETASCPSGVSCLPQIEMARPGSAILATGTLMMNDTAYFIDLSKSSSDQVAHFYPSFAVQDTTFSLSMPVADSFDEATIECGYVHNYQFFKFPGTDSCANTGITHSVSTADSLKRLKFDFDMRGVNGFDPLEDNRNLCGPAGFCSVPSSPGEAHCPPCTLEQYNAAPCGSGTYVCLDSGGCSATTFNPPLSNGGCSDAPCCTNCCFKELQPPTTTLQPPTTTPAPAPKQCECRKPVSEFAYASIHDSCETICQAYGGFRNNACPFLAALPGSDPSSSDTFTGCYAVQATFPASQSLPNVASVQRSTFSEWTCNNQLQQSPEFTPCDGIQSVESPAGAC